MTKTILITGCSSGFGRATALESLAAGWNVVATMRDPTAWDGPAENGRLLLLPLDVNNDASVAAAVREGVKRYGKIDVVVNNAGKGLFSVFEATSDETAKSVFETNVFGPMRLMRTVIPLMREAGGGRIVNVTSSAAISPEPLLTIYSASKAALDAFTEAVQFELVAQNISVKVIEPGFVRGTKFVEQTQAAAYTIPVPAEYQAFMDRRIAAYMGAIDAGLATDEDVAKTIVAAAKDESGQLRWVIGADAEEASHMRWETSDAEYAAWSRRRFT